MKYVLTLLAGLLVGALAWVSPVEAGKKGHPPAPHPGHPPNWNNTHHYRPSHVRPVAPIRTRTYVNNYHIVNGNRFRFGYYYNGYNHNHWSYHYWDTRYGAYLYYDPYALAYFYWCAPHFRYYPVTYAPVGYVFPYVEVPVAPAVPPPAPPPPDDPPPATPPG